MPPFLLDWLGSAVCHRLPGHTPLWVGALGPLCFRCAGIYLGAMAGLAVGYLRRPASSSEVAPAVPAGDLERARRERVLWVPFLLVLAFGLPAVVDGWGSGEGFWRSSTPLRWGTGLLAGGGFGSVLWALLRHFVQGRSPSLSLLGIEHFAALAPLLAALFGAGLLLPVGPARLLSAAAAGLGLPLAYFLTNLAVLGACVSFPRRAVAVRYAILALAVGAALGELALMRQVWLR